LSKIFVLLLIFTGLSFEGSSSNFILDNLGNPGTTTQGQNWSFFTDGVMGGLSEGQAIISSEDNIPCYKMTGNVTTENNGGFIQIRTPINPIINAAQYEGIYLRVKGNNKKYSIHIRTPLTIAPWQYYSYSFKLSNQWSEIKVPFFEFKKSNFYEPKSLYEQSITYIGLIAGFDNFYADICLAEIGFF
jgi:hypothetical protein